MTTLTVLVVVYGACAPLALLWAARVGFLPFGDPIVVLRVPAVIWIGPLLAFLAIASGAAALLARAFGKPDVERALAWWRR